MKKCAKENNISTNELVKLNRIHQPLEDSSKDKTKTVSDYGTLKGSLGVTKNCGKRKRKNKFDEYVEYFISMCNSAFIFRIHFSKFTFKKC